MNLSRTLAVLSGPFFHHLDHLAPLAYSLGIPLLIDTPEVYEMGKHYYPFVDIQHAPFDLFSIGASMDCLIVSTKHAQEELAPLFALQGKKMRFCFCPHGQSEKGLKDERMLSMQKQDLVLFYGKRQKEIVKPSEYRACHIIGNFRLAYYQAHKEFYDALLEKELFSNLPKGKTILYAPTWNDPENGSSFFAHIDDLLSLLPEGFNLVVKLHPFLEKEAPAKVYQIIEKAKMHKRVKILLTFPLIYPLLNRIDLYLGDFSSISFDFLFFDRPMFFLKNTSPFALSSGQPLANVKQFYTSLSQDQSSHSLDRKRLYEEAFAPYDRALSRQFFTQLL